MIRLLSYITTLFAFALLSACGGGGGSPGVTTGTGLFTTAPSGLNITVGGAQDFSVGGGRAPYNVVSNNTSVAVATVSGNTLTIGGVKAGTASITVRDAAGTSRTVDVTVAPAQALGINAPSTPVVSVGASNAQTFTIRGGVAPYTVASSNPAVLGVALTGNSLTVTGLAAGSATVSIFDSAGGTLSLPVTVSASSGQALFTTAPSSVTVATGTGASYSIGGGTPPYTVTSSNTGVATGSVNGTTLTISGLTPGSATMVIRDAAGSTTSFTVAVSNATMTLSPAAATALVGDTLYTAITGGVGPFSTVVTNAAVADATIGTLSGTTFTANPNGRVLRVLAKQQASGVPIIVTDATGSSASFTLTSSPGQPSIQISPSSLTISERNTTAFTLNVYGSNGSLTVFSSDPTILQASVSGTTITVSPGTSGNSCVAASGSVTISAVDSSGAKATSVITVTDNPTVACP